MTNCGDSALTEQLKNSNSGIAQQQQPVVNDAALRPPTTMAPPVPVKKKISIPPVFLVDDQAEKRPPPPGNGSVRTLDRLPPPRPMRPSTEATLCNALSLSNSSVVPRSSLPQKTPSLVHGNRSSHALLSLSPSSQSHLLDLGPQPQPPPRRYNLVSVGGASPSETSLSKSLSAKVKFCLLVLLLFFFSIAIKLDLKGILYVIAAFCNPC